MTSRILAGFLGVLTAVLAAVVIPLGIVVAGQQAQDFRDQAGRAARAVSAVAEEHLDDHAPIGGLRTVLARFATDGYDTVVLDRAGQPVASAGSAIAPAIVEAVRAGARPPRAPGSYVTSAPVSDSNRMLGRVVLTHDTASLERRQHELWATLTGAAAAALALGAVIAWLLSRWIARPLAGLAGAARGIGRGDSDAHADDRSGPTQVREVAAAFNTMAERVSALLRTQREMTAEVSHQLRTPLAALRLRLELLHDELGEGQANDVTAMIEETSRLARLLDGLLAVARAEATSPAPAPTDVSSVAAERVTAWEPVAADQRVELCLAVEPRLDAGPAAADTTPGYLEQILDNLLDNAINASPPAGRVVLTVRATQTHVSLTVVDSGPGMDREQRTRARHRWATDRAGNGGTGLGLAIVTRLVEADHGTLELCAAPDGGLVARVDLPRSRDR